jgi:transposase
MRLKPDFQPQDGSEELKEATRTRRSLIEERTQSKNRLHKLLRFHFPGYQKTLSKELTKRLLVTISAMPSPDMILATPVEEIARMPVAVHHYVGQKFAQALHTLATVAPTGTLPETTRILVQGTARHILELDAFIAQLDVAIKKMLDELHPDQHLTSIPGIGDVSAAAILAEVGDIKRFPTVTDFIGYCGLYPIVWESGAAKRRYRMTRKGNRMLKLTLLVVSTPARRYNPVVGAFYDRLRGRGKSKKAAGGACARKLAELVYAILTKNEPWSDDVARRGMAKAEEMSNRAV